MLTLLGSLLGFVSSALPDVLKMVTARADRQHELDIMDRQIAMQGQGAEQKLAEIQVQADITESVALYKSAVPTGVAWVDALSGTVRPVITYAFFTLFAAVKGSALYVLVVMHGAALTEALPQIWDGETAALFAATISFWFGQRALAKLRGGL